MDSPDGYIPLKLAAKKWGLSERSIRRLVDQGVVSARTGETPEGGGRAPLLVEEKSLHLHQMSNGAIRQPAELQSGTAGSSAELRIARLEAQVQIERLTGRVAELEAEARATRDLITELRHRAEVAEARAAHLEAEARVGWWGRTVRLITG